AIAIHLDANVIVVGLSAVQSGTGINAMRRGALHEPAVHVYTSILGNINDQTSGARRARSVDFAAAAATDLAAAFWRALGRAAAIRWRRGRHVDVTIAVAVPVAAAAAVAVAVVAVA